VRWVEDDWMKIDLACAAGNECNAARSPVRLHPVTMPAERLQQVIECHLDDIDGEIEVAVGPGLMPNQCVDTPPAGDPDAVKPCPVSDIEHSADIGTGHVPARVVTDVRHHEASQAAGKLSAPVGYRLPGRVPAEPLSHLKEDKQPNSGEP
jgi:hypothetical protein